uniref:NADH dehydrogenase [ubiquinone] 1 alpha subcomplex subunit 3 n=1 Tax=Balaenoptera musculus TaxID=9771 RepID=A0A8C0CCK9_BALMU
QISRTPSFLRNAWAKELVLVVSFTIGGLIIILPTISPYTKYAIMINQASPYNHPDSAWLASFPQCLDSLHTKP